MARKPRIHFPGAVYHVILRGNGGQNVFFSNGDRAHFYKLLHDGVKRFAHRILSFCQMTNHIHLVVQVGDIPLSRIIQNLSFRYTRYINQRKNRIGHLFQGRYKAILVDADSHLLELVRYIHLNPVRAGICSEPLSYRWSSHHCYLSKEKLPWVTTDWVLSQFAPSLHKAQKLYAFFVAEGIAEGYRQEFHTGNIEDRILGDDNFAEKALLQAEGKYNRRLTECQVVEAVCKVYKLTFEKLTLKTRTRREAEARAMAALVVLEFDELTLVALGKIVNRDISSLSQAARRLQRRLKEDSGLILQLDKIKIAL